MLYNYLGFTLIGLFALMIVPTSFEDVQEELKFYGAGTIVVKDASGNEVFRQTVHNQLTDQGEQFLIDNVFREGSFDATTSSAAVEKNQIGAICITDNPDSNSGGFEGETATTFDADVGTSSTALAQQGTGGTCRTDTLVTNATSTAVIGALTFQASSGGNVNAQTGDRVAGFGICQATTAGGNSTDCATSGDGAGGILFSIVNITNVTLANNEQIDITYTFDITSANS